LEKALDRGAARHPESRTCGDFRAPRWLASAEAEALAAAGAWITPHSQIAKLAGSRAIHLPWHLPRCDTLESKPGDRIVFPASTLCRKGAYELREAASSLSLPLHCGAGFLEGPTFWNGVPASRIEGDCLYAARVVVLPAYVEHRPRRLLAALARGIPVIATPECGLEGMPGVTHVPSGDAAALETALCPYAS
jgi:glycosyltransferase involved in cell wall biosynthesis